MAGNGRQLRPGKRTPVSIQQTRREIVGGLRSTGQKCTATSRVIVQSAVYEPFKEKLMAKVKALEVGDGLSSDTWMGPCASESHLNTVLSYIE